MDLEKNPNVKPLLKATEILMEELDKKRENKGMLKRKYKVLVIGIPNAGKSTLINRLAGKKVVGVGNMPGVTKQTSWIRVSESVELLDTPGILWPKFSDQNMALNLASMTIIKEEILAIDMIAVHILKMLDKYYKDKLKECFGIDYYNDDEVVECFEKISKFKNIPVNTEVDYERVSYVIINAIKQEKIKGITFDRL